MNIVIFNWRDIKNPWAGGSELNVHEMAKQWILHGHTVTMLAVRRNAHWVGETEECVDGIRILRVGGRFSVYVLACFYYLIYLRHWADCVIDVENGIPFFTPLFVKVKVICLVNHIHQTIFFKEMWFPLSFIGYGLETYLMPFVYRSVRMVSISETTKSALIKLGFISSHIRIINPGINHLFYHSNNTRFENPTILYIGKIKRYKNISVLIDIFFDVRRTVPDVHLIIAGDGYDRSIIQNRITNLHAQDLIELKGYVTEEEKLQLYQKAWVYVTPSQMEGWGLTVIEANACGLPVIAFSVPGLIDSVKNRETGFLVSSKEEMVESITLILQDSSLRNSFSQNAVRRARAFSWEASAAMFLQELV